MADVKITVEVGGKVERVEGKRALIVIDDGDSYQLKRLNCGPVETFGLLEIAKRTEAAQLKPKE